MIKKLILIILISIALSGCEVIPEIPEINYPVYRGFFVGVGDYIWYSSADLPCGDYNSLKMMNLAYSCRFGENDVEFSVVKRLFDWGATKENILNGILETFAGADENDVSYFYLFAHGGLHKNLEGELVPCLAPTDSRFEIFDTLITVHELEECLSSIPGTKVVWIESCYSGNLIGKGNIEFNTKTIDIFSQAKDLLNKDGYQVLVSSSGTELTYVCGYWSYFAEAIFEGCENLDADVNGDEIIDQYELYKFIREWIGNIQHVQAYPENSTFPLVEY